MKELWRKIGRTNGVWLGLIIILQTILYLVAGANKAYFHMDEIYSYGLANYERVQIYETEGFYNTWHTGEYYDDYLTVGEEEQGDFLPVYENQKNDVHPPLFYLLLRLGMEMLPGKFSQWIGIGLNIIIFALNTGLLYSVIKRLWQSEEKAEERATRAKTLLLTLVVATSVMAVSTVIYIRMYALLTLWITLTTYLHVRLLASEKPTKGLLAGIGIVAFLGFLTQYYYLFFIVAMYGFFTVHYAKRKEWAKWRTYTLALGLAGVSSLIIWPYSVQHMLFSNRGGGVLEHLLNPRLLVENIWQYLGVIDLYVFHCLLLVVLAVILVLGGKMIARQSKIKLGEAERTRLVMVLVPTMFYLMIVAAVSPFIALRYVAPVCGLVLVSVVWILDKLLAVTKGKRREGWLLAIAGVFLLMPLVLKIEPDVMYSEYRGATEESAERAEIPALYIFHTGDDWVVLNDLLLLREIDESYLAKDVGGDEEKIRTILRGKDLSRGLTLFINDGQDNAEIVEAVEAATSLKKAEKAWRMPTSEIYYLQ